MFVLEQQSRVPIYEQMKQKITELIMLGVLKTDEQLPSVRSLAHDLGINPNTVQKAYQELERDGVVYSVTGKGSFVAPLAKQSASVLKAAEEELDAALRAVKLRGMNCETAHGCVDKIYGEVRAT